MALLSGLVHINYEVASAQVESARAKLARVDFLGVGTLFLAFGSFLVSLSLRNNERLPWSNVWVITSTALAPVFFALFILVEAFWAREPGKWTFLPQMAVSMLTNPSSPPIPPSGPPNAPFRLFRDGLRRGLQLRNGTSPYALALAFQFLF